jgi:hypothetical protein
MSPIEPIGVVLREPTPGRVANERRTNLGQIIFRQTKMRRILP